MAPAPPIRVKHDGGHAELVLDAPPGNRLDLATLDALVAAAAELSDEPPASLLVRGEGKAFCVGLDPAVFLDADGALDEATVLGVLDRFSRLLAALDALPCPTVAALVGPALGGGLELALACDLRVASATAALALPEVRLGVLPGGGATQRLPRLVGRARAKDLLVTGRRLSGEEALAWGLVGVATERADVVPTARAAARRLAGSSVWAATVALRRPPAQNWK